MKLIKGLGLLSFLVIFSGSCFEPPEFPAVPQIEFEGVEFVDSPEPSEFDSLILHLNFKDGNGDLGFNESADDISFPFHNADFYQENNGSLEPLYTTTFPDGEYDLLHIPDPTQGKLVVFRTRKNPEYGFLPATFHCSAYEYLGGPMDPTNNSDGRRLLILKEDVAAMDPAVELVDSLQDLDGNIYYQIRDTLYYTPNPDHYNIEVDFLVKDPSAPGGFKEFDWQKEFCTTFDGRFPVFSDKNSSIDGSLRYSMTSLGFTALFSIKTLKLRVSIKDRERHQSNVIETTEFTLH
ncbi:MAG: hypothetical protein WEB30_01290 [Cyclobacteriaceae bacterium]